MKFRPMEWDKEADLPSPTCGSRQGRPMDPRIKRPLATMLLQYAAGFIGWAFAVLLSGWRLPDPTFLTAMTAGWALHWAWIWWDP